ncbi:DnaJ C-terminal domain-containing protein [Asticcacaulis sp. BYS171W]|uniref:DnaJ C-terminal domain-containing protein n=1 Tax=Asticcacaulis aquaticus TaxID=2984212 RepID=A0ABT5HWA3_9CAUL|nr:DnaJ C-terminal domain-containing protein [Asticcacaulis aquaticus]MDC7684356.1 DnaJ C-terminal domain-containing protein [Asticcacaulis aquaticus]
MNRSSALALLDLGDDASLDHIQSAFRKRAKQAHPDLNGGTDAHLRRLILARDLLLRQLKTGVNPTETIDELADPAEILRLTPEQAVNGGVIVQDVPMPLELIRDNGPNRSLMHTRSLRIALPKGLRHGDRLRLKASRAGTAEHLFRIEITRDERMHVAGNDLWMTAEVDARRVSGGGPVSIDTPHGPQDLFLGRTTDGACLCLKGLGLPATATHAAGDLYVRLAATALPARPASDLLSEFHKRWA